MRMAVTIGKLADGSFVPLALPDRDVMQHRAMVRGIIMADGVVGKGKEKKQLAEILYFDTVEKRKRFQVKPAVTAPADDKKAPADDKKA